MTRPARAARYGMALCRQRFGSEFDVPVNGLEQSDLARAIGRAPRGVWVFYGSQPGTWQRGGIVQR